MITADETPTGGPVRLSINLSAEAAAWIRDYVDRKDITIVEAIRRCISTQKYIEQALDNGDRILREHNDELRELIFVI